MVRNLIVLLVIGLVAGVIAREVTPSGRYLSTVATVPVGLTGSFVGNLLGGVLHDRGSALTRAGWIDSITGAIVVLGGHLAVSGRRGIRTCGAWSC